MVTIETRVDRSSVDTARRGAPRGRSRRIRRATLSGMASLALTALVACSSPLDGDDAGETPTPSAPTPTTSVATPTEPPTTMTSDAATQAPQPTGEAGSGPTAAATSSPAADPDPNASPSPTGTPLPEDGAELFIDGQAVTLIISGSENGRTLYAIA